MVKRFFIILALIGGQLLRAQCARTEVINNELDEQVVSQELQYIYFCPKYNFSAGGSTSGTWDKSGGPVDIALAPPKALLYKKKVDDKIRDYAGEAFFSRVRFGSVDVVFTDSLQAFYDDGNKDTRLDRCLSTYFYYYELAIGTTAIYNFGVALNSKGKIISELLIPPNTIAAADTSVNYCRLAAIAKKTQPDLEPLQEIRIEFDPESKNLCWIVLQGIKDRSEGLHNFNIVKIDVSDLRKVRTTTESVFIK